jgi:hypothetical protein
MNYETIRITLRNNCLAVTATDDLGGRGDAPPLTQSSTEKIVTEAHQKLKKFSAYKHTSFGMEGIDHYESCGYMEVPGAVIKKGDRKARDYSGEADCYPKAWEAHLDIQFGPSTRIGRALETVLEIVKAPNKDLKKIQKSLKDKGEFYLEIERQTQTSSRGGW